MRCIPLVQFAAALSLGVTQVHAEPQKRDLFRVSPGMNYSYVASILFDCFQGEKDRGLLDCSFGEAKVHVSFAGDAPTYAWYVSASFCSTDEPQAVVQDVENTYSVKMKIGEFGNSYSEERSDGLLVSLATPNKYGSNSATPYCQTGHGYTLAIADRAFKAGYERDHPKVAPVIPSPKF